MELKKVFLRGRPRILPDAGRSSAQVRGRSAVVRAHSDVGTRTAIASTNGNARGGSAKMRSRPMRGSGLRQRRRPMPVRIASAAYQAGFRAGRKDAGRFSLDGESFQKQALNRRWFRRAKAKNWDGSPWSRYTDAAKGYVNGYFRGKGQPTPDWLMMPTTRSVAAIVSVMNEESTIERILDQLNRIPLDEVYVLVNGSTDRSFQKARQGSNAVVLYYPERLGHDVGRALGAKLAQSDILLFLDGDIVLSAEDLIPFIGGIEKGLDIALNNISPYLNVFSKHDQVTLMKQFLNASLGRPDLEANSLTAVPHALSRMAVETLGFPFLMVPPKAQALALHHGLKVGTSGSVDVISRNKRRKHNTGKNNLVADLIIGDHLEALKLAGDLSGERLSYADTMRKRSLAGGED
jgi:hypothetical protein